MVWITVRSPHGPDIRIRPRCKKTSPRVMSRWTGLNHRYGGHSRWRKARPSTVENKSAKTSQYSEASHRLSNPCPNAWNHNHLGFRCFQIWGYFHIHNETPWECNPTLNTKRICFTNALHTGWRSLLVCEHYDRDSSCDQSVDLPPVESCLHLKDFRLWISGLEMLNLY